ncbi:disease resistance protein RPS2 [Cinnamomum micranthum f. kanehirae]|uniref:Disease resistance protein RPS2 n=1 Tax=Cinnamomum micranthum f. kanehirae TaxID=337451 RepID=A0A3S3MF72_9MAGN|nr:disease resistance protein RPS2 [Cinnamomum micranthum f. kanehirae]
MAQNETVPYSNSVKRVAEQLLEWLKNPDIGIILFNGWHGVGRWRIVEYATKLANDINLFDILISLNLEGHELSRRKLQLRIAESLGIQSPTMDEDEDEDGETDTEVFRQIYEKLKDKRFLLVLGAMKTSYSNDGIDLTGIGVPNLRRRFTSGSKVISKVILVGEKYQFRYFYGMKVKEFDENLFVCNVTELIREEAALAAHSARTKGYFSPDTIMHFIYYFSLAMSNDSHYYSFLRDKEWMIRYWIAEELIAERMEKDEEALMEIMDALLTELHDRSIVKWGGWIVWMNAEVRMSLMEQAKFDLIFYFSENGLPEEDDESCGWEVYQRMSAIINTQKINVNIPPSPKCPNLTTLILQFDTDHSHDHFEFPIAFFDRMKNLRVLDLYQAPIESLPSSLSSLSNLKLLSLKRCDKLASLPTSLRYLIRLEFLNLSECHNLKVMHEECFELMDRLRVLDLSGTEIDSLPWSVFKLYNLQQLLLCECRALKSLPSSLSDLVNLEKLYLSGCNSLKTGVSPQSLQNLTSLKELYLSKCEQLEDIRVASFHDILPKLRRLNIFETSTPHCLSFRGCESLETLDLSYLSNLEALHVLYGTKFKTLYLVDTDSLRRLDILPTRYPYVQFEGLNWRGDDVGARIWVEDLASIFKFTSEGSFQAPCFSRFYIRISPFEEEGCMPMTIDKFQNIQLKRKPVVYESIYHSHTKTFLFYHFASRSTAFDKTLEICRSNSSLKDDIYGRLLARTESITFLFNTSDIGTLCPSSKPSDLKECRIGGCPKISSLFAGAGGDLDILPLLEVIWVADLPQLITICDGVHGNKSFALLKHIYIEHCPKLVVLFTSGMNLQSLEILEIKFCCRLQKVFKTEEVGGDEGSLQNLRSLCLLHVPKLKSVCNGFLPQLEKVQVQRCPMLRKLPIQVCLIDHDINGSGYAASSSLPVVEIRGETKWWKNLQWDNNDDRNKRPARFRPWRSTPSTLLSHGIEW